MTASRTTPKKKTRRAGVRVSSAIRPAGSTARKRNQPARKTQSGRQPKPTTAYELCNRVAQHIEEEPLRYHQQYWGFEGQTSSLRQPACGTICCRAGWIVNLHDGIGKFNGRVGARSNQILGLDDEQTFDLYYDGDSFEGLKQGTARYAKAGAAGLRKWMRKHAEHLKARLLKDVPKLGSEGQ